MSLLLVGAGESVGAAVIRRLVSQGDEVRVVENEPALAERWRSLGAHVARGPALDADLFERAAQNCRTVVLFDDGGSLDASVAKEVLQGAAFARVERAVVCAAGTSDALVDALREGSMQYVLLTARRARGMLRKVTWSVAPDALARAVDAADDLAGDVRLEVDLGEDAGWEALGLDAPRA